MTHVVSNTFLKSLFFNSLTFIFPLFLSGFLLVFSWFRSGFPSDYPIVSDFSQFSFACRSLISLSYLSPLPPFCLGSSVVLPRSFVSSPRFFTFLSYSFFMLVYTSAPLIRFVLTLASLFLSILISFLSFFFASSSGLSSPVLFLSHCLFICFLGPPPRLRLP